MKYDRMVQGIFRARPNRFIAHVEIEGRVEVVHVKNTGRCKELLAPGCTVYLQKSDNPERKTGWDLIGVEKANGRVVNMDSQITNYVVKEWIEEGNLYDSIDFIRTEKTYKNSRFDIYLESGERKVFVEVKGVTLEEDGVVRFPDAPSERAIKHINELIESVKDGYEAYVFFVIQMKGVEYFTPNRDTQPEFAEVLLRAKKAGVKILAYDSQVTFDEINLRDSVPVVLGEPTIYKVRNKLVDWYVQNRRELPWRENVSPYHVWVSEIMLQQTRVEAVKGYYERFLRTLPTIEALAEVSEDQLLKLWEGLGYYNRVRNMQIAAKEIMERHGGRFPSDYESILALKGIGSYTAGAISAFAFNKEEPAVDGNVLRVICRFLGDDTDITKASLKSRLERDLKEVIPEGRASDFNQGLIELGAVVCVPNGAPKCDQCPLSDSCVAYREGLTSVLPVKSKAKERKVEKRTVLIFKDGEKVAINKRPGRGLLAKLYELPNYKGHMTRRQVIEWSKSIGLTPIKVNNCESAKHIFSHIEWQMIAYEVKVDELEKVCTEGFIFETPDVIENAYPIPSAFAAYTKYVNIELGKK